MIPLVYFLLVWLVLIGIFALMTFLTVLMSLRHGVAGFGTYASTILFLIVTVGVLLATGSYLLTVDWSQNVELFSKTVIGFDA